jgi:hypothetical protein
MAKRVEVGDVSRDSGSGGSAVPRRATGPRSKVGFSYDSTFDATPRFDIDLLGSSRTPVGRFRQRAAAPAPVETGVLASLRGALSGLIQRLTEARNHLGA